MRREQNRAVMFEMLRLVHREACLAKDKGYNSHNGATEQAV